MLEILKWMHESFWNYLSVCFQLFLLYFWLAVITTQISKIGRPRKHVIHTYKETHKL